MARGIGRALQKAVAREGLDVDLDAEGRSLANARRRQVYRYLCLRPCARIGDVGRDLSMSQATARRDAGCWETVLRRRTEAGLSPELLRRDETTLLVRFGAGSRRTLLEVPLDPYATAWMRHA